MVLRLSRLAGQPRLSPRPGHARPTASDSKNTRTIQSCNSPTRLIRCLRRPLCEADGNVLREAGKLRMWFSSATLGKGGLHTLHESRSDDGIHWEEPSPVLLENVYCPTVLKTDRGYEMWFSDVSRRPWVIRHATSADGRRWTVTQRPAIVLSQEWEGEVLIYPTVLKIDDVYLMWYGSYDHAVRRETTAIGFAASLDGQHWYKHPSNPVLRPDPQRPWESNYVGSGCVLRLPDGSFRYWYASRKEPPFLNLYFAINTARWAGPVREALLRLPPEKGDEGKLVADASQHRTVEVLEVIDDQHAIVRAWYLPPSDDADAETTFVDLWIHGVDTKGLSRASRPTWRGLSRHGQSAHRHDLRQAQAFRFWKQSRRPPLKGNRGIRLLFHRRTRRRTVRRIERRRRLWYIRGLFLRRAVMIRTGFVVCVSVVLAIGLTSPSSGQLPEKRFATPDGKRPTGFLPRA